MKSLKNKIYIVFLIAIFFGCKTESDSLLYSIDLTALYKNHLNSYKINQDGNMIVLINTKNELGHLYKARFSKLEMDTLQYYILENSKLKCDSLINPYTDGINFKLVFTNSKEKKVYISNTCENSEILDKIVKNIITKFETVNKKDFFESKIVLPPPPPAGASRNNFKG